MEMLSKKDMGWPTFVEAIRTKYTNNKNVNKINTFCKNEEEKIKDLLDNRLKAILFDNLLSI